MVDDIKLREVASARVDPNQHAKRGSDTSDRTPAKKRSCVSDFILNNSRDRLNERKKRHR